MADSGTGTIFYADTCGNLLPKWKGVTPQNNVHDSTGVNHGYKTGDNTQQLGYGRGEHSINCENRRHSAETEGPNIAERHQE